MNYSKCLLKTGMLFLLLILCSNSMMFSQDDTQKKSQIVNILFTDDVLGDINRTDARAVIELGISGMLNEIASNIQEIRPDIVSTTQEIIQRAKKEDIHVVGLFSLDFFKYQSELNFEPFYALQESKTLGTEFVVLVRTNSKINSLADLKSKKILTINEREEEIARKWLFVKMKKEGIKNPSEIISPFVKVPKASKRILSVFLKKADACIVTKLEFESMCELNPQIEKQIKILDSSPAYITQVYCLNLSLILEKPSNARSVVAELNKTSKADQMLKLFKAKTLVAITLENLSSMKKLYTDYNLLSEEK